VDYRYGTLAETGSFTSNRLDSPPFTAKRFRSIAHYRTPAAPGVDAHRSRLVVSPRDRRRREFGRALYCARGVIE
jgi:hypothetical protein